ncbi:MAG TPA: ABC transporter permease, partial [Pirellulales bacterium]
MSKVWKLAIAFLREQPVRVMLTSFATIAATCTVIWVAAGYDAMLSSFDVWANVALGRYELAIAPISPESPVDPSDPDSPKRPNHVPDDVLPAMRGDPAVAAADPFWVHRASVYGNARVGDPTLPPGRESRGGLEGGPPNVRSEYTVLSTTSPAAPFELKGEWIDPASREEAVVLRAAVAERLAIKLGDAVKVVHNDSVHELKVIGLLDVPSLGLGAMAVSNTLGPALGDVFIARSLAEKVFGAQAGATFLGVAMKPEADVTKFRFGWATKLSKYAVPVQFQEAHEIEERLDELAAADNVRMQSYAATGIALLVSLLVVFCTVNMGVTERVRQFAVLRALGLTRFQLCSLIFAEGLLLATIGLVGGLLVGSLLLSAVAQLFSNVLRHGASIGAYSLGLATASAYGGAILAAAVPAWRATRVRPLDAMSPAAQESPPLGLPIPLILSGAALMTVWPTLAFVFPPRYDAQVFTWLAVGFVTLAVGVVLVAPALVALVDRLLGPLLARMLRVDPKLLASQISSNIWRTVAAAASMAVGMGLYIGVQVWGYTMLEAFIVGPWAPDAVLAFRPEGLPLESVARAAAIPGVNPHECLPIVVEQPRFLEDVTGSAERASVTRQDNVVIVGVDPTRGFDGPHALFDLEWVAGEKRQAIAALESGRGCIVPDHFLTESRLHVGDSFELAPPKRPGSAVRYTIAGAVKLPGWHWQTKLTGFRTRTHRAAALVFAKYENVASDFSLPAASHLWFNYDSPAADPDQIAAAAKEVYSQAIQRDATLDAAPRNEPSVRIMSAARIRASTRGAAARWLWTISVLPIVAVLIAGFGVLNVILASVRSRQWEFGVLRSIGVQQSAIVRAIMIEGVLIGVVSCLISLTFGILAGWCGCGVAQYMSFFGGLHPPLTIPLGAILIGL